jgi:hypothetical protein
MKNIVTLCFEGLPASETISQHYVFVDEHIARIMRINRYSEQGRHQIYARQPSIMESAEYDLLVEVASEEVEMLARTITKIPNPPAFLGFKLKKIMGLCASKSEMEILEAQLCQLFGAVHMDLQVTPITLSSAKGG